MANTYVALAKTVLTTNTYLITFSSIPQTYTDLLLTCSARDTASTGYIIGQFNAIGTDYSETDVRGDGITADGIRATADNRLFNQGYLRIPDSGSTANTFGNTEIYFPNYSGSAYKVASATSVNESNVVQVLYITMSAGLSQNTAATTQLKINGATSFLAGSRFDLYGIKSS